jgi:hypothetical protein
MLVPALLVNQAAMCCAHSHHGDETDDHSARTHVHLSGESHDSHSDSHHHSEPVEHKHSDELPIKDPESGSDFEANLPVDHDSDALYFGEHDNFQFSPNRINVDGQSFATMLLDTAIPRIANSERRTQATRAGPITPYYGAIFLQTRRLLL